jgi:hypothetical protein
MPEWRDKLLSNWREIRSQRANNTSEENRMVKPEIVCKNEWKSYIKVVEDSDGGIKNINNEYSDGEIPIIVENKGSVPAWRCFIELFTSLPSYIPENNRQPNIGQYRKLNVSEKYFSICDKKTVSLTQGESKKVNMNLHNSLTVRMEPSPPDLGVWPKQIIGVAYCPVFQSYNIDGSDPNNLPDNITLYDLYHEVKTQ